MTALAICSSPSRVIYLKSPILVIKPVGIVISIVFISSPGSAKDLSIVIDTMSGIVELAGTIPFVSPSTLISPTDVTALYPLNVESINMRSIRYRVMFFIYVILILE